MLGASIRRFAVLSPSSSLGRRLLSAAATATKPSSSEKIDKEALSKLRKRTGYSFVNCRKALLQFGSDKLPEAEKWLREQAVKEGWAKAAKLSGRRAAEGLVSAAGSGAHAVVVELRCETDFVARAAPFKELLEELTLVALDHAQKAVQPAKDGSLFSTPIDWSNLRARSIDAPLSELVTVGGVGKLGENIQVHAVTAIAAPSNARLSFSCHPNAGTKSVEMGSYAAVVALQQIDSSGPKSAENLGRQLAQHIIGMRSTELGTPPSADDVAEFQRKMTDKAPEVDDGKDELNAYDKTETTRLSEDETRLLHQSFMLNPTQTVYEHVTAQGQRVVDFVRVELGGPTTDD